MKRKLIIYGAAAILLLTALLAMDRIKLYKEEKPPLPVVTVDGNQLQTVTGSYKWNGTTVKNDDPAKLLAGVIPENATEQQKLAVSFHGDVQPKHITISQWNTVPGIEKKSQAGETFTIPASFSSHPDQSFYFKITAEWDKNYSTYYVKLRVQDRLHFEEFLTKKPGTISVLAILPPGDITTFDIPSDLKNTLEFMHISQDLEGLKKQYPELQVTSTPAYLVFNTVGMVQTFEDKEALIQMLKDRQK